MLTGTLVTAAGFLPIGLANSAVGEYTGGIFWVVGIALVASWFVAVLFTPYLGFKLLPNYARGSSIQATEAAVKEAERLIAGDADAQSYTSYIGKSSPRFWLGLQPVQPNESFAQIVIVARDVEARERIKARIEAAVAKGALSAARVRLDRFNFGPPVGFPVQFRVVGPEPHVGA